MVPLGDEGPEVMLTKSTSSVDEHSGYPQDIKAGIDPCREVGIVGLTAKVDGFGVQVPIEEFDERASSNGHPGSSLSLTLSPSEQARILRGASVSAVLMTVQQSLRSRSLVDEEISPEDALRLWALAKPVEQLDEFVSHCWRDSGRHKLFALLLHYNGSAAAVASMLVMASYLVAEFCYFLPQVSSYQPWCLISSVIGFVSVLLTWHLCPKAIGGSRGRALFFDKLCVHQADAELKAEGIRGIAAFVGRSKRMLLLWSPKYFTRLWCTLEVAALAKFASDEHREESGEAGEKAHLHIVFMPQAFASATFKMMGTVLCIESLNVVLMSAPDSVTGFVVPILLLCTLPFYMHSMRAHARERLSLEEQLDGFSVHSAECWDLRDRDTLQQTITTWFGSVDAFDMYVRHDVKAHVRQAIGPAFHFPLHMAAMGALPSLWSSGDFAVYYVATRRNRLEQRILGFLTAFCAYMLAFQASVYIARFFARRRDNTTLELVTTGVATCTLYILALTLYEGFAACSEGSTTTAACIFSAFVFALASLNLVTSACCEKAARQWRCPCWLVRGMRLSARGSD